jgi:hypothetical protein
MSGPQFDEYPKWMRHPAEQAAVVSDDYAQGQNRATTAAPGKALRFPPVCVQNADQEAYHAAQGYVPSGKSDPSAFLKATISPTPPGYQHHEYPRMLPGGLIDQGPNAPQPPDNFYPYWLRMDGYEPTLVQDREEHEAVLKARGASEPPSSENDHAETPAPHKAKKRGGEVK